MRHCLLALTILAGCSTAQRATSTLPMIRGASSIGARVIGVELPIGEQLTSRHDIALVEIDNPTGTRIAIEADGFSQVGNGSVAATAHTDGGGGLGGGAIAGGFGGGGSSGSFGSGGSGSLGSAGSAAGSVGAGALGLALLVPVLVGALVNFAATQPPDMPRSIGPGRSVVGVPIANPTDDRPQHVVLALRSAAAVEHITVPLFDPARAHGGWNQPHRLERFALRAGGGPFWGDGHYSGSGGLEILGTTPIGPTALGIGAEIGVDVAAVAEIAVPRSLFDDWLRLVPSIDVRAGATILGSTTFLSPTLGLDALVAVDRSKLFGYSAVRNHVGVYGRVGPVWLGDGERLYRWEVGISVR